MAAKSGKRKNKERNKGSTDAELSGGLAVEPGFDDGQTKKALSIRLQQPALEALTRQAHAMGIGPSTLARIWITERLRATRRAG